MKILHITKTYDVGGMFELTRQISERLVEHGHDVTVATRKIDNYKEIVNGVKVKQFDLNGNWVTGFKGNLKEFQDFVLKSDFDIVTSFAAQHTLTDAFLQIMDNIKAKKVFVPTGFSALYNKEYFDYFHNKMKIWLKKYDMNIFSSNDYRDINFARENNITNIMLIPNGASKKEFLGATNIDVRKKIGINKDNFLILHIGSHTGQKGHSKAMEIFKKAKIKNSTFVIVAQNKGLCYADCKKKEEKINTSKHFKKDNKKIIVQKFTRDETVALLKEADLFIFPSNIECSPIVLFETMASKTPFLATDVGNSIEIARWSESGIILPTIKRQSLDIYPIYITKKVIKLLIGKKTGNLYSIAKTCKSAKILEKLYNDKDKLNKMGENGYKAWINRFTWEKISDDYENLYKKLLKNHDNN